jgi:hypothetical protein
MNIVQFINSKIIISVVIVLLLVGIGMMVDISMTEKRLDNEKELKKKRDNAIIVLSVSGVLFLYFLIVYRKMIRQTFMHKFGHLFDNESYMEPEEPHRAPRSRSHQYSEGDAYYTNTDTIDHENPNPNTGSEWNGMRYSRPNPYANGTGYINVVYPPYVPETPSLYSRFLNLFKLKKSD